MIKLSEFLTPLENFQYSVNLEYDLNNEDKIKSYIENKNALEIFEEIILSTNPKSNDRARLLTGAYGKGKSHLTLMLLGLLAGKDKKLFERLVKSANQLNPRIAENIKQHFESGIKLLPVLLNSQSADFKSTLLQGLRKALLRVELDDIMPTTFFEAAINKIESWQSDYPKTYKAFTEMAGSVEATLERLRAYDSAEYNYFTSIYPSLTSGSEFNPLQGADVIAILDSIVDAIKVKGYSGIFIVYDEFSKFLDGNIETGSAQNVKLLQDLAERCNRSGAKQIHLLLVSHKNIENYVGDLPKKVIDDWKGISRRFKPLTMEISEFEIFGIIAKVLQKDSTRFNEFINEAPRAGRISNADRFKMLKKLIDSSDLQSANKRSAFADVIKHTGVDFVEKCYPLHPYSLLLLPKISELVAQNERTIFTFLASDERYAVKHFIRTTKDEFPLIEPDQIYDYFEPQFKGEPHGSEIRRQWQITASALGKLVQEDNALAVKIVKSVILLYIVNQFDVLPPSLDLICEMYSAHSIQEVNAAIEVIRQSGLLIELEFKPHVRIRELSGNNADALVEVEVEKQGASLNIRAALRSNLPSRYILPEAYNDNFGITRYFEISFVDYKVLKQIQNIKEYILTEKPADGYVFAVIVNDEFEREESIKEILRLRGNRVVFAVPKTPADITKSVVKYTAIQNVLRKEKNLTESTVDELKYVAGDQRDLIDSYIDTHFFSPELKKTDYYYDGAQIEVRRRTGLSTLLSKICENVFGQTPVIVNENVNRENLSAPMKATRLRILESLLLPQIPRNFGLQGSQDINVVRSLYLVPRIISNLDEPKLNTTEGLDANFLGLFNLINSYIESSMSYERKLSELYKALKDPDDGMALRSGVIPFYIAAALYPYKTHTVFKRRNREVALSAEVLEQINERPDEYSLRIENWDTRKSDYIAGIEKAVYNYVNADEREYSSFNYIVTALQKWYLHLTRFDRETMRICDGTTYAPLSKFESDLKRQLSVPEINAHEFLFERLPKMAGAQDYTKIVQKFQASVLRIESNSKNVLAKTIAEIKQIFGGSNVASLNSVLLDYYESLSERTKGQVFSGSAAKLLEVIRQKNIDDNKTAYALIRGLFGLRLDDFSDSYADSIEQTIKDAKDAVDGFNKNARDVALTANSDYEITFLGADGKKEKKHISASDLPTQARSFANEIESLFEEYGESLTTAQKAQVFLEVMKKLFK